MKYISISICLLLCILSLNAASQTISRWVIGSTGSSNEQLSYTVGETVISTGNTPNFILTQGFQQPDQLTAVSVDPVLGEWTLKIYPNPTSNDLVLEVEMENPVELMVQFTDVLGRLALPESSIDPDFQRIKTYPVNTLAAGVYFLVLRSKDKRVIKTFKFEKID